MNLQEFISVPDDALLRRLEKYIDRLHLHADYSDQLLLDIEHPIHFRNLSKLTKDADFPEFQSAYKRRIVAVRKALPYAEVIQYGVFAPTSKCKRPYDYPTIVEALHASYESGLFDGVDYLGLVLYLRHSSAEESANVSVECQMAAFSAFVEEYRLHDFGNLALFPLLSASIYNRDSDADRAYVYSDEMDSNLGLLRKQVKILKDSGFTKIGIWTSGKTGEDEKLEPKRVENIAAHLMAIYNK